MRLMLMKCGIFLCLFVSCACGYAKNFSYIDIVNNISAAIQTEKISEESIDPPSVAIGGIWRDAKICGKEERYICIRSEVFNFAVPRADVFPTMWSDGGFLYKITTRDKFYLLGVKLDVVYIQSKQRDLKYTFIYSRTNGLVAFKVGVDSDCALYISQDAIGFGNLEQGKAGLIPP